MRVFVLDRRKRPLMPTHPARARKLLQQGRARVHRRQPFTIRLVDRDAEDSAVQPVRIKVDPGASVTGLALTRENGANQHVLWLGELTHRGQAVHNHMTQRQQYRRTRRSRKTRHRQPRFQNRRRREGWLPPSVQSRCDNVVAWMDRLRRWAPVTAATVETVKFDTQALRNPHIAGTDYQNGPLAGYEVWEYLLHRDCHTCVYCGASGVPLERDHVAPKSKGGTDRVGNLVVACRPCNEDKGNRDLTDFLAGDPQRLKAIRAKLDKPLNGAAAVNATRRHLPAALRARGLAVETASGGRTRANRDANKIPKGHALDAACAGCLGSVHDWRWPVLAVTATGRGSYQRTRINKHGFPRGYLMRQKQVRGLQTGDLVRADVPTGKKAGTHTGRVAVRQTGWCNIQTATGTVQGINAKHLTLLQRADGYAYAVNHP